MHPSLVLWDWNGTLLDDVDLCVDALNRLLARFHYPQRYDKTQYREIFCFPVQDYYVRAGFDFSRTPFDELARSYMEDYIPASATCPLADGALEALDLFSGAGVRQVVDTLLANRLHNVRLVGMQRGHALHQQEQQQQQPRHALTICIPCFGQDFKTLIV